MMMMMMTTTTTMMMMITIGDVDDGRWWLMLVDACWWLLMRTRGHQEFNRQMAKETTIYTRMYSLAAKNACNWVLLKLAPLHQQAVSSQDVATLRQSAAPVTVDMQKGNDMLNFISRVVQNVVSAHLSVFDHWPGQEVVTQQPWLQAYWQHFWHQAEALLDGFNAFLLWIISSSCFRHWWVSICHKVIILLYQQCTIWLLVTAWR